MIDPKELRSGNYLQSTGLSIPRLGIHSDGVNSITPYGIYLISNGISLGEPIELTEDWLLRMGFVKKERIGNYDTYIAWVNCDLSCNNRFGIYFKNQRIKHIKYVHELQNLFHSHHGKELYIEIQ